MPHAVIHVLHDIFGIQASEEKVTIFDALFGCWHKRKSFPLTAKRGQRRSAAAAPTGTYVVCLDCGKEFAYDWQDMQMRNPRRSDSYAQARVEVEV